MPQQPILYDSDVKYDDPAITWDGFMPVTSNYTTMPSDNRISASITAENKTAFNQAIAEATALIPFVVNLTPEEKKRIASVGLERGGMLDVYPQEMTANPNLVPPFIDMAEMNKDLALFRDLMVLHQSAFVLAEKLNDTMKLTSGDLFTAFSAFYASVKEARRRNVPGADAVYGRLAPFFARTNGQPATPPAAPVS